VSDPFEDYEVDDRPTAAQLLSLPRSRTGLGLEMPRDAVERIAAEMSKVDANAMLDRFCDGFPGDPIGADDYPEHACRCEAMDIEGDGESVDWRRADLHVTADDMARQRFRLLWLLHHQAEHPEARAIPPDEFRAAIEAELVQFAAYD
jgi:hypothetical protein